LVQKTSRSYKKEPNRNSGIETEMKHSLEELKSRFGQAEERTESRKWEEKMKKGGSA
jgi:hypothetical protein